LTVPEDYGWKLSLDYVFYFKPNDGDRVVRKAEAALEKFMVNDRPYTQLSDHYGIAVTLHLLTK
jgi:endonuclease/exonuclease/phosphatase family metal-dependent hydrolase